MDLPVTPSAPEIGSTPRKRERSKGRIPALSFLLNANHCSAVKEEPLLRGAASRSGDIPPHKPHFQGEPFQLNVIGTEPLPEPCTGFTHRDYDNKGKIDNTKIFHQLAADAK